MVSVIVMFGSGFLKFDGGGSNVVPILFGGLKMSSVVIGFGFGGLILYKGVGSKTSSIVTLSSLSLSKLI